MPSRFEFLEEQFPKLSKYGRTAEQCITSDPNICLLNLGRIAETITEILCSQSNIHDTSDKLAALVSKGIITQDISQKISALTELKNEAVNDDCGSEYSCSRLIVTAEDLCRWFVNEKSEHRFSFMAEIFPPDKPVPVLMNFAELGREAEENLYVNTRYCLICLGDMGEAAADRLISEKGIETHERDQVDRIDLLSENHAINDDIRNTLHALRMARNKAIHERYNEDYTSESEARKLIDDALVMCQWLFMMIVKPGYVVKARVTAENDDGYSALIGKIPAVVQGGELIVGKKYVFKVIDTESEKIILSQIKADKDYDVPMEKIYAKYKQGRDVHVTLKSLSNSTGAVVELKDGLEARIPPSELGRKIYAYDKETSEKLVRYETTARVKWFSPTQYPPLILSVKDVEENNIVNPPEVDKEKTAMSDMDFRLLCKSAPYEKIIQALDEGANPNASNNNNTTALMMAAQYNKNSRVANALIEAGAKLDEQNHKGNTALMYAAMSNNYDVVRAVYDAGADAGIVNSAGKKAADFAAVNRKLNGTDILSLLRGETDETPHEADEAPVTETPETEETPMYYEIQEPEEESEEDTQSLLDLRDRLQRDFLRICRSGTEDEIAEAVSAGVNVNVTNKSSATALMFAAQNNTAQAVEILVHAGASLDAQDNNGNTALIYAVSFNQDDVVEALIDAGADRDIRNFSGYKAVDYAAKNYRLTDTEAARRL